MNPIVGDILARITHLEEELEAELERRRHELKVKLEHHRVHFDELVLAQQRRYKMGLLRYVLDAEWRHVASIPFILGLALPMMLLDLVVSIYQWICFPLYRIRIVRRRDFWVYDRSQLAYLNLIEKINCAYCSYGNGLAAYFTEIASLTEQYWCPIKHSRRVLHAPTRYSLFLDYGDAESYRNELENLREQLHSLGTKEVP